MSVKALQEEILKLKKNNDVTILAHYYQPIEVQEIADFLAKNYSEPAWAFDVDLLYLCKKKKFKILEYPIDWTDAEGSKLTFKAGISSLLKLISLRVRS